MFTVENSVGRLIEIRGENFRKSEDIDLMISMITKESKQIPADKKLIILADYRTLRIFPPEVAEKFVEMLSRFNPKILRSSILLDTKSPTIAKLQMSRIVEEAQHSARQSFETLEELKAWNQKVLTQEEFDRLQVFFQSSVVL